MCHKYSLEFEFAGMTWQVELSTDDGAIDAVESVKVYAGNRFVPVAVDTFKFVHELEDILYDKIEEYKENLKEQHGDYLYDVSKGS